MVIEKEIKIKNSIENVWKVLGHDFANPHKWASLVNHAEGHGVTIDTANCNERSCETTMGRLREKLTYYSEKDFSLAYIILEGMPAMIKYATNSWRLIKVDEKSTLLKLKMEFHLEGFMGFAMQPLVKMKMKKMAKTIAEDFAYYAENGKPHPRKLQMLKSTQDLKN